MAARRESPGGPAYVLVHGTGHGGWCWGPVADALRAAGRRVYAPTLTGLGERSHLLTSSIGLVTHIEDVCNVVRWEELDRFVIVGHTYGGYVTTGLCDRFRDRVAHAFYLDAPAPRDGDSNSRGRSLADLERSMGPFTNGALPVRPGAAALLGIPPEDAATTAWVERRLTPHPMKTWVDPIRLVNGGSDGLPRTFVFGNQAPSGSPIRQYAEQLRRDRTFRFREIPCGHNQMVIVPGELAQILLDV